MSFFNVITLFGGLAMFLYGMRLMGDSLKDGSSGTLKKAMTRLTGNPIKAFLMGLAVTAIIQSSTATIVITSGLVAAGILTLRQSLGIIIGANVGTTVTGQIIRLLDINGASASWLQVFKPSTLAPVALILGIVLIMAFNKQKAKTAGNIAIGFGILFSGLLNMTGSVDTLSASGVFDNLFAGLGTNPLLGYLTGAGVAFVLQSSSATIGILQAFSMSGHLAFKSIYAVIVGIYLGDCVTTAIVCSIGAKADAKRVGIVNILFNLSETVLVLLVVTLLHKFGLLDRLWDMRVNPGVIANTNTVFNLGCAVLLFPLISVYEKLSLKIVRNDAAPVSKYADKIEALSPQFFSTPAIALSSCYDALMTMFNASCANIEAAYSQFTDFDAARAALIREEENNIDELTDHMNKYLVALSPHITQDAHGRILDQYYKIVTEFERLGDHAMNIAEIAEEMNEKGLRFSSVATEELAVVQDLVRKTLYYAGYSFEKRNADAANHVEPLEEVVDDVIAALTEYHVDRLRKGQCNVDAGTCFLNLLSNLERISDICSNIGLLTLTRIYPELEGNTHNYSMSLHTGSSEQYNAEYTAAHDEYFSRLAAVEDGIC